MKKKQIQMIGMLLALVVLAAAFLGIRQYNKNAPSATSTTEDTQETVLDVNSDDITSFRYVYEGETYAFEKEDDTWYYADDHSLNLNQDRIKAMILKVAPLKADQVIENVTDMSQYGLADPERTIQYETADRSVIINVGNLNSMTSQYYIAFPSEMKVYVVTTNVVTGDYRRDRNHRDGRDRENGKREFRSCNGDNGNCSGGSRLGMLPTNDNDVI